jgi:hypothetical protein
MSLALGPHEYSYPVNEGHTYFDQTHARPRAASELEHAAWRSLAVSVALVLYMYYLDHKERAIAQRVDRTFITASDFAIEVRDIPVANSSQAELKGFFGKWGKIAYIEVAYESAAFSKSLDRWQALHVSWLELREKEAANAAKGARKPAVASAQTDGVPETQGAQRQTAAQPSRGRSRSESPTRQRQSKLESLEAELVLLEEQMRAAQTRTKRAVGTAIVTYEAEASRRKAIRAHSTSFSRWLVRKLTCGCCARVPLYLKKHRLTVLPAPEPDDV